MWKLSWATFWAIFGETWAHSFKVIKTHLFLAELANVLESINCVDSYISCFSCSIDLGRLTVPQPCCQGLLQLPGSRQSSNLSLIRRQRRRQRRRHRRRRRPRHRQPQPGLHNRNWLVSLSFSCDLIIYICLKGTNHNRLMGRPNYGTALKSRVTSSRNIALPNALCPKLIVSTMPNALFTEKLIRVNHVRTTVPFLNVFLRINFVKDISIYVPSVWGWY